MESLSHVMMESSGEFIHEYSLIPPTTQKSELDPI